MRGFWMVLKCICGVWRSWRNFRSDIFTAGETSKRHRLYLESQLLEYLTKMTEKINLLTGLSEQVTQSFLPGWSRFFLQDRPSSPSPAVRKQRTGGKEGLALIWSSCTLHLLTCLRCSVTAPDNFLLILLPGLSFIHRRCMKESSHSIQETSANLSGRIRNRHSGWDIFNSSLYVNASVIRMGWYFC